MPRVDRFDVHLLQTIKTLIQLFLVFDIGCNVGLPPVGEGISREQGPVIGKYADRSRGMARNMQNCSIESIFTQILAVVQENVRFEFLQ